MSPEYNQDFLLFDTLYKQKYNKNRFRIWISN